MSPRILAETYPHPEHFFYHKFRIDRPCYQAAKFNYVPPSPMSHAETINASLAPDLTGEVTTLASCWQNTRRDSAWCRVSRLHEVDVPFFGAFGAAWDDVLVVRCSATVAPCYVACVVGLTRSPAGGGGSFKSSRSNRAFLPSYSASGAQLAAPTARVQTSGPNLTLNYL